MSEFFMRDQRPNVALIYFWRAPLGRLRDQSLVGKNDSWENTRTPNYRRAA